MRNKNNMMPGYERITDPDGGAAFPFGEGVFESGAALRDIFAAHIVGKLIERGPIDPSYCNCRTPKKEIKAVCKLAYDVAGEMVREGQRRDALEV